MPRHHDKGQTLFELAITSCILSILFTMGTSHLTRMVKTERARAAVNRMATAVQEARRLAISHKQITTLCPSTEGKGCAGAWEGRIIIFRGRANSNVAPVSSYAALERGHMEWRSFRQDNFLEMQQNGMTLAQNGSFVYCPEDRDVHFAHALIINKSGRVRFAQDTNGDGIRELANGNPISC